MSNELHTAAADKNGFSKVKELIEANPSIINDKHTEYGTTAICFAAQSGSIETLEYLIAQGATLFADKEEQNLLYWASQNSAEVIAYVTNPKNKLIEQFQDGTTYFHAAILAGDIEYVEKELTILPELFHEANNKSQSSLYWALLCKQPDLVLLFTHLIGSKIASEEKGWTEALDNFIDCYTKARKKDFESAKESLETMLGYCKLLPEGCHEAKYYLVQLKLLLAYAYFDCKDYEKAREIAIEAQDQELKEIKHFTKEQDENLCYLINLFILLIKAKDKGLSIKPAENGAKSFYMAMIDQLQSLNDPQYENLTLEDLQSTIYKHILENMDYYQDIIGDVEVWFNELIQKDTVPCQIAILALSRAFDKTLYVFHSRTDETFIYRRPHSCPVLKFSYWDDHLYYSLHDNSKFVPEDYIEFEIAGSPKDDFVKKEIASTPKEGERTKKSQGKTRSNVTNDNSFFLPGEQTLSTANKEKKEESNALRI